MTDWKTVKLGDIAGNDFMDQEKLVGQDIYPDQQVFPETKNDLHAFLMNEKGAKKLPTLLTEVEAKDKSERLNALREALEVVV
jgi:hypothetical protein